MLGKFCTTFAFPTNLTGDKSMKIDRNKQIPNFIIYLALYTIIFGISIWLLTFHKESSTNWVLYVAMIGSVLAGLVKFAFQFRKRPQHSV